MVQSNVLLSYLITFTARIRDLDAAQVIIHHFEQRRFGMDPLPVFILMLLNPELPPLTREFFKEVWPYPKIIDAYLALVNAPGDAVAMVGLEALEPFESKVLFQDWKLLLSLTDTLDSEPDEDGIEEEYQNPKLRAFFETQVERTAAIIVVPPWVRALPKVELTPPPSTFQTPVQAIDMLLETIRDYGLVGLDAESRPADLTQPIIGQYCIGTMEEKTAMIHVPGTPLFNDTPIFREMGPLNSIYDPQQAGSDLDHICNKFGGCRMFTCVDFERDEVEDTMLIAEHQIPPQWYRGQCDECHRKIGRRHHAVRMPLPRGGWKGCYCSCECILASNKDPLTKALVCRLKDQLQTLGIRDR
jgi:hypothetical protein